MKNLFLKSIPKATWVKYRIDREPKAGKDIKELPKADMARVIERLQKLEDNLRGDVKHRSNHFPDYRMRAGD